MLKKKKKNKCSISFDEKALIDVNKSEMVSLCHGITVCVFKYQVL